MSISEPIYNAKRGDVDHALGFKARPFPKKTAAADSGTHKFLKGDILAKDPDDTTKALFSIAESDAVKPFIMARGISAKQTISDSYILSDAQLTYVSAFEEEPFVSAVFEGYGVVEFAGTVQQGDGVMPAADGSGKVKAWDGVDEAARIGFYQFRPGYSTGEFLPGPVISGQLGWISINK